MASSLTIGGQPATTQTIAESLIASLGNDSPSATQIAAMEAWVLAEKPAGYPGGKDTYSANPLNITYSNGLIGKWAADLFVVPDWTQNNGNPVVQFIDGPNKSALETGIYADAQFMATQQPTLAGYFSKPQNIDIQSFTRDLAGHWGTSPSNVLVWFDQITGGNASTSTTSTGTQGSTGQGPGITLPTPSSGSSSSNCTLQNTSPSVAGVQLPPSPGDYAAYLWCQVQGDLVRGLGFLLGAILVVVGVIIVVVDDIKIPTPAGSVSVKEAAASVAE